MSEPQGYVQKLINCRFPISTNVKRGFTFNSEGVVSGVKPIGSHTRLGICAAMSSRWILKSIQLGKPLAGRQLVENLHETAIAQSAYEVAMRSNNPEYPTQPSVDQYLFGMFGLKCTVWDLEDDILDLMVGLTQTIQSNVDFYLGLAGSYFYVTTKNHAMALHFGSPLCYLFDPDNGLYSYKGGGELIQSYVNYVNADFPSPQHAPYYYYRLELDS